MTWLLCSTRSEDYDRWKAIFDSHADAHREAGCLLEHMWREVGDPNNAFFLFRVTDRARAQAFLDSPESAQAGQDAGVIDGSYHFVESAPGY